MPAPPAEEFVYRLPGRLGGRRPGAHRSTARGAGMQFIAHARLLDQPDPRRLDLRASLGNLHREWLVRVSQQRGAIGVAALVDVSASMHFGEPHSKLDVATQFVSALGDSATGIGDAVGMQAFDAAVREELAVPLQFRRGIGEVMAARLGEARPTSTADGSALADAALRVASGAALVFLVSDFHWPLGALAEPLETLSGAMVVPLVVWDCAEVTPPERGGLLSLRQLGARAERHLWLGTRARREWRENVDRRRRELAEAFAAHDVTPLFMTLGFDAQALSRYFVEAAA